MAHKDGSGEIDFDELAEMMSDMMGTNSEGRGLAEKNRNRHHVEAEVQKMLDTVKNESSERIKGGILDEVVGALVFHNQLALSFVTLTKRACPVAFPCHGFCRSAHR